MLLSQHAADRMRQRSIPLEVVEVIGAYAEPLHSSGAVKLCIDRQTLELIRDDLGCQVARTLERFRGVYLVEIAGTLVTAARRTRRLRRGSTRDRR